MKGINNNGTANEGLLTDQIFVQSFMHERRAFSTSSGLFGTSVFTFFCLETAFSLQIWSSSVGMTCNFGVLSNRNTFGSVV